jgi:hypothetical protein
MKKLDEYITDEGITDYRKCPRKYYYQPTEIDDTEDTLEQGEEIDNKVTRQAQLGNTVS